jgi:putative ABC transport system permease protein
LTDWSYVPEELYQELSDEVLYASAKILVKLKSGAEGKTVADQIWELDSDSNISWVYSVEEQLETRRSDPWGIGITNIQRLGIAFAILAASVGTALVTLVSLKERSREASLMSVRGLSYKQLVIMLLTENLAIVTFAVLLGALVGLIIVRGSIAATNAVSASIVAHRMVFPTDSLLLLLSCVSLIFASTIIPVIVMARRYVSRLERMVRLG